MQQPRSSQAQRLQAADAHQLMKALKHASNATTLGDIEESRLLSAAQQLAAAADEPQCHAAYCEVVGQQQHMQLLIQATYYLLTSSSGQRALSRHRLVILTALSSTVSEMLMHGKEWECYGFSRKDTVRWMVETGLLTQAMRVAPKATAALNSYSQARTGHQALQAYQHAHQQLPVALGLLMLWQGACTMAEGDTDMDLDTLATLEQAAGLVAAILRSGQAHAAAMPFQLPNLVYSAASRALFAAWHSAVFVADFTGQENRQPPESAATTRQVLGAADVQQMLLVHVASLAAGLHRIRNGHSEVSINGSGDTAMQLDVPAWHDPVLKEFAAGWVKQSKQESFASSAAVPAHHSSALLFHQQLYQALAAAYESLKAGRLSGSTQRLQHSMLLALPRMFVEVAVLMPDTEIVRLCISCSNMLFNPAMHVLALGQDSCEAASGYSMDSSAHPDQANDAAASPASNWKVTPVTAAALLPPVLNLLAPAVLHVLSLDGDSGFQRFQLVRATADKGDLTLARLVIVMNMTGYMLRLVEKLDPKHLAAAVFHKPLISLSILEAAIRHVSADAVTPSGTDSSLSRAAAFVRQTNATLDPELDWHNAVTSELLAAAFDAAAASGKLTAALSAPPAGMPVLQWEGLFCRQLTGLMITSLKLQQLAGAEGSPVAHQGFVQETQLTCARDILSSVSCVGTHVSRKVTAETTAGDDSLAAEVAQGRPDSINTDAALLCVAVVGRGLRLLGLVWGPETAAAAPPELVLPAGDTTVQHLLLSETSPTAAAAAEWAVTQLLASGRSPEGSKEQLLQQYNQLLSTLEIAIRLDTAGQLTATPQEQLQQLPELLKAFGSAIFTWVPQQQWCHNVDCCSLNMLRESALVAGQGKVCAGCRAVRYCGRECQVQDWSQHKHVCKAWRVTQL